MDKILCQNLKGFQSLIKRLNPDEIAEMGLCYKTEITDKKGQTIVREGEFPFPDKEKLVKTYQKVVFVKEADAHEKEQAQKGRNFLKSIFQDLFEDKKVRQIITFLLGVLGSYHIYQKNLLPVLICLVGIIGLNTMKPQTKKETRKNTTTDKESVMEELNNLGLSTLLYDTEKAEDIHLYVKQVMRRCLPQKNQDWKDTKILLQEFLFLLNYFKSHPKQISPAILTGILKATSFMFKCLHEEIEKSVQNLREIKKDIQQSIPQWQKIQVDIQQSLKVLRAENEALLVSARKSRNARLLYKLSLQV